MAKSAHRLDGEVRWWVGIAVLVGLALAGMWQQTSANTTELRERMTAVETRIETLIPIIHQDIRAIEASIAVIQEDIKTILDEMPKG